MILRISQLLVLMNVLTVLAVAALAGSARAEITAPVVRLVVMNDQSGAYSDNSGKGSVVAAQLAVDDFGGKVAGVPIEVIGVDDQNKPDIAAAQARKEIETDQAAALFDFANTGVSLVVQEIAKDHNKVAVHVGSASADLYGKACSPTGALWLYDTYSLARGLAQAIYDDAHRKWFLLVVNYAFGQRMQEDMTAAVEESGGTIVGAVRHPLNTADFSSYLLQAAGLEPQVLALLNAGADADNAVKQAAEFGLVKKGVRFAVPILSLTEVHAMGAELAQGTTFLQGYYPYYDEASRAFAKRFAAKMNRPPSHIQAGVYSAVLHYLKGVAAANSIDGRIVMQKMKEIPVNDFMTKNAKLREDGRLMRDMLLVEVKKPQDVKDEWDLLEVHGVIPAEKIIRPLAAGHCPI
ncbi:MAG: ABC transporter substrate-binding protein [Beijerinckiaceae bacterium]